MASQWALEQRAIRSRKWPRFIHQGGTISSRKLHQWSEEDRRTFDAFAKFHAAAPMPGESKDDRRKLRNLRKAIRRARAS